MFTFKPLLGAALLLASSHAFSLASEGVYTITQRTACQTEDLVDSVVILSDAEGTAKAFLASAEYGLVYQVQKLTFLDGGAIQGVPAPSTHHIGVVDMMLSEDGMTLTGTVDTTACPAAWTFTAQREQLPAQGSLEPADSAPAIDDFLGSFEVATASSVGTLRFLRIDSENVVGAYLTQYGVMADFHGPRLDAEAGTLEMFSSDDGEVRLKWNLSYGKVDGVLALEGYGISSTGRFYPVSAKKL